MISIVVRTRDEEQWIGACLDAVRQQTRKDVEIIVVDNQSSDRTLAKARQFDVVEVHIDEYLPGKSLNAGIAAASGEIIVCLSGHCIPVNDTWLANLVEELDDPLVGGVYGRQQPLSFSADIDKRDLLITFGLDRREQVKDSFFHNANSAFRRSLWQQFPFDSEVAHIEDRIWAHQIQAQGLKLVYRPDASVYHHHGIHHSGNPTRCSNTVKVLESMSAPDTQALSHTLDIDRLNLIAVVPVRQDGSLILNDKALYLHAVEDALASQHLSDVWVVTEYEDVAEQAKAKGAKVFFLPEALRGFDVLLEQLMQACLKEIEALGVFPDYLVMLEPNYPLRPQGMVDSAVLLAVEGGFDAVLPARAEINSCWLKHAQGYQRVDRGHIARQFKEPVYIGIKGLVCVSRARDIRQGRFFGDKVGVLPLQNTWHATEVRSAEDIAMAAALLEAL